MIDTIDAEDGEHSSNKPFENKRPVVVCALNGWGVLPPSENNAFHQAKTPFLDSLISTYPVKTLLSSSESVGAGKGNHSDVSFIYSLIGSGIAPLTQKQSITSLIQKGLLTTSSVLNEQIEKVNSRSGRVHIIGILSDDESVGSIDHLQSLLRTIRTKTEQPIYLHIVLDGINVPEQSGVGYCDRLNEVLNEYDDVRIVSVAGQSYACNKFLEWDKTEQMYQLLRGEVAEKYKNTREALKTFYSQGITDADIPPTVIGKIESLQTNDVLISFNFDSSVFVQLAQSLVLPEFSKFSRGQDDRIYEFVTFFPVASGIPNQYLFNLNEKRKTLLSRLYDEGYNVHAVTSAYTQTEVTQYVLGTIRDNKGEFCTVIPLEADAYYNIETKKGYLPAADLIDSTIDRLEVIKETGGCIFSVIPDIDIVSHTGDLQLTVQTIQSIDKMLKKLVDKVLGVGGTIIITSLYGNAEEMVSLKTGEVDPTKTAHPVPCILISRELEGECADNSFVVGGDMSVLSTTGTLGDIASTVLDLCNIDSVTDDDGNSLL